MPTFRRTACLHTIPTRCQIQSGPIGNLQQIPGRFVQNYIICTEPPNSPAVFYILTAAKWLFTSSKIDTSAFADVLHQRYSYGFVGGMNGVGFDVVEGVEG